MAHSAGSFVEYWLVGGGRGMDLIERQPSALRDQEARAKMYCPKCATENIDTVRYCRQCGTHLELVPQAITGRLPEEGRRRRRRGYESGGEPDFGRGLIKLFSGLGFLVVAIILSVSPAGRWWWYWMLIPAFGSLGKGIVEILKARSDQRKLVDPQRTSAPIVRTTGELPPQPDFAQIPQPPSVTEDTTRRFEPAIGQQQERQ